jgi:hypothetical protein
MGHFVRAHDLVTLHYSDDDTDYPVRFQLWKPADLEALEQGLVAAGFRLKEGEQALKTTAPHKWRNYLQGIWRRHQDEPAVAALYHSKLLLAEELLHDWVETQPPFKLPVTFDNWYTQPAFCRYLAETLHLDYVGSLAESDQVLLRGGPHRLDVFAAQLKQEHLAAVPRGQPPVFQPITIPYKGEKEHYYSYCATHRLLTFGRQRLVIDYRQADLRRPGLVRLQSSRMASAGPHAHPTPSLAGGSVSRRGQSRRAGPRFAQVRDWQAIERQIGLVAVAYSLLRAAQQDPALQQTLHRQLKLDLEGSTAFWRRATQAQSLWSLALVISAGLSHGESLHHIMAPLLRTLCTA